ncbi:MAG TPA: MMPL family transporter [Propionibacteriaceae bacterium]|nr:MMPL family transporter [Propionibacteriaceae bacterium]
MNRGNKPRHALPQPRRLERLGMVMARHWGRVVAAWLVVVVVGFALALGLVGEGLFARLHSGNIVVPGQSQAGVDALNATSAAAAVGPRYTIVATGARVTGTAVAEAAATSARAISQLPHVESVATPWTVPRGIAGPQAAALLAHGSAQSGGFAVVVTFTGSTTKQDLARETPRVDDALAGLLTASGATSTVRGGTQQLVDAVIGQIKRDLEVGEGLALPVTFVVMILVFGGFVAAGMPLAGAIASIAGAFGALLGFSYLMQLDATVVNIVTVLGLGLSIDYGLLIVSRYREELRAIARGRPASELTDEQLIAAAGATVNRAGRTVLFSGLTVAISLVGLLLFQADILRAIGAAGVTVVAVAILVALTLVPALCRLGARRLLRGGTDVAPEHGVFSRLAQGVQRAPWVVIVVVAAVLVVLAIPSLSLKATASGAELLPVGAPQRTLVETLRTDYPLLASPEVVVISKPGASEQQVAAWASGPASALPGVTRVDPPVAHGDLFVVGVHTGDGGLGDASRQVTTALRTTNPAPFPNWVTGQASNLDDFTASTWRTAPWTIALVVGATLVLLFLLTGSVVIPVKALVMNVLSLGASLGAVVWGFQDGHLQKVLDFTSVGAVEQIIPIMVLAFGFGLSMDYEVFLLSRVVELHEQGRPTDEAVALGLQRSGRIISSAAVLIVIVFAGFMAAKVLVIKETGLALVLAVALDASLVRMLLVPATMTVLGQANWWAPPALRRLHQRFGIVE